MLVAVATSDKKYVNQHFGHAQRFLIYKVDELGVHLVDEKEVERYCSYDADHPLRGHILRAMADALGGCRAIVCSQIGDAPRMEMERLGFVTFVAEGEIAPTLLELSKLL